MVQSIVSCTLIRQANRSCTLSSAKPTIHQQSQQQLAPWHIANNYSKDCCHKHVLVHVCTFDIVPLLDRRQQFELLEDIDSVVQHVQHYWDEDAKADPPGGARCSAGVRSMSMAAAPNEETTSVFCQKYLSLAGALKLSTAAGSSCGQPSMHFQHLYAQNNDVPLCSKQQHKQHRSCVCNGEAVCATSLRHVVWLTLTQGKKISTAHRARM